MNGCENMHDLIWQYIDDELEQGGKEELAEHIAGCAQCAARLKLLLAMRETAPELAETPPEGFAEEVMAKIAERGAVAQEESEAEHSDEAKKGRAKKGGRRFHFMPFTTIAAAAVIMIACFQTGFFGLLASSDNVDIVGDMGVTISLDGADSVMRAASPTLAGDMAADSITAATTAGAGLPENAGGVTATSELESDFGDSLASMYAQKQLPGLEPLEAYENGLYCFVYYVSTDAVPADVYDEFISTLSELPNDHNEDHYYIVSQEQYDELYKLLPDANAVTEASYEAFPHILDESMPYGAVVFY